jgi:hypothetical protein
MRRHLTTLSAGAAKRFFHCAEPTASLTASASLPAPRGAPPGPVAALLAFAATAPAPALVDPAPVLLRCACLRSSWRFRRAFSSRSSRRRCSASLERSRCSARACALCSRDARSPAGNAAAELSSSGHGPRLQAAERSREADAADAQPACCNRAAPADAMGRESVGGVKRCSACGRVGG